MNDRVSPLVRYSKEIMVISVGRKGRLTINKIPANSLKPLELVDLLKSMKVNTLICGGIKEKCQKILKSNNITLIENVIGNVDDVVKSYLDGNLHANIVIIKQRISHDKTSNILMRER